MSVNTSFNHKLYGKCALIPNWRFKQVSTIKDLEIISYINLQTGIISDSGVHDAGIIEGFSSPKLVESNPEITEALLLDFGYIKSY